MDEAKIIDNFADLGEDIADPFSALAILLKAKVGGGEATLGVPQRLAIYEFRPLAGIFYEVRFIVEGVYLRRAAGHEELNDMLSPRGKVRNFRGKGTWLRYLFGCGFGCA
tara:strand:- start:39 stop:368 length:330 start_codon:yes stop_codon:yes gene_type:complete